MTSAGDFGSDPKSVAVRFAKFLKSRGVDRIFRLEGGLIQRISDHAARLGIRIVGVSHECAAAHAAHAGLTGGFGVAKVMLGPGGTKMVTAIRPAV